VAIRHPAKTGLPDRQSELLRSRRQAIHAAWAVQEANARVPSGDQSSWPTAVGNGPSRRIMAGARTNRCHFGRAGLAGDSDNVRSVPSAARWHREALTAIYFPPKQCFSRHARGADTRSHFNRRITRLRASACGVPVQPVAVLRTSRAASTGRRRAPGRIASQIGLRHPPGGGDPGGLPRQERLWTVGSGV